VRALLAAACRLPVLEKLVSSLAAEKLQVILNEVSKPELSKLLRTTQRGAPPTRAYNASPRTPPG
jgi:hypothetical protein